MMCKDGNRIVEERDGLLGRFAGWWNEARGGEKLVWLVSAIGFVVMVSFAGGGAWTQFGPLPERVNDIEEAVSRDSARLDRLLGRVRAVERLDTLVSEVRELHRGLDQLERGQDLLLCLSRAQQGLISPLSCNDPP